jgi:mannose-1-phosphate guanylyltransferase
MREVAVIMAGGSGTRLWPLSRRSRPKQLLRIVEGSSLLFKAFERLRGAFAAQDIYVIALAEHLPAIATELPDLPASNLIGEPVGRDTTNAIALAAAILHRDDPDTVMGVFTADHLIRPADRFAEVIRRGYAAVGESPDALVTFGIKPTEPHTGLGYVECGEPAAPGVWAVRSFKEKPDLATAERYVASGKYFWNSGTFVWRTQTILEHIKANQPIIHAAAQKLAEVWHTSEGPALAADVYPTLPRISIDYAVMEKMFESEATPGKVLVVEMALDWLDVGHWTALSKVLGTGAGGNTSALRRGITLSCRNNVLACEDDHLIAAIGVDDLIIVHSPDATLVCHKDQIDRIKELVAQLDADYGGQYS